MRTATEVRPLRTNRSPAPTTDDLLLHFRARLFAPIAWSVPSSARASRQYSCWPTGADKGTLRRSRGSRWGQLGARTRSGSSRTSTVGRRRDLYEFAFSDAAAESIQQAVLKQQFRVHQSEFRHRERCCSTSYRWPTPLARVSSYSAASSRTAANWAERQSTAIR